MKMSEYSIEVFKDPKMLRSKLDLYLQSSPEKVEIYANACERFFYLGGKRILKFDPTWSWWGFFCRFFLYRKNYIEALVIFICSIF